MFATPNVTPSFFDLQVKAGHGENVRMEAVIPSKEVITLHTDAPMHIYLHNSEYLSSKINLYLHSMHSLAGVTDTRHS